MNKCEGVPALCSTVLEVHVLLVAVAVVACVLVAVVVVVVVADMPSTHVVSCSYKE